MIRSRTDIYGCQGKKFVYVTFLLTPPNTFVRVRESERLLLRAQNQRGINTQQLEMEKNYGTL